jgi:hypothetical protein
MDTKLFVRSQPGGMFSVYDAGMVPGNVFFVDSTHASALDSVGYGRNPDAPFKTLDYAVGQCTASKGDMIIVMPGHIETVAGASGLDFDVEGIKVIGLGWGDMRPKVMLTASASTVELNADDMWIENLIFQGDFTDGVVVGLDIKTGCDDLVIKDCVIRAGLVTKELLKGVTIEATNNRITFDGCFFYEFEGGDATTAIFSEGAVTNLRVVNCRFHGDWSVAVFDLDEAAITTEAPYFENVSGHNADDGAGLFATVHATTTAKFINCHYGSGKNNTSPLADSSASWISECYGTEAAGKGAVIWPLTATNYGS